MQNHRNNIPFLVMLKDRYTLSTVKKKLDICGPHTKILKDIILLISLSVCFKKRDLFFSS